MSEIEAGSLGTVNDKIYIAPDDKTTVSRSKLEHLKDMADDNRMQEESWLNKIISIAAQGLFFTSLGSMYAFDTLSENGKRASIASLSVGGVLTLYNWWINYTDSTKRKKHRSKLVEKLHVIITQMDKQIQQKNTQDHHSE